MDDDIEQRHLRRCVELAAAALAEGDEPFGSVLVAADGTALAEDHNRVASGDRTRHPEFELARWAAANMTLEEREAATVFTSGEHCPMCAAAHGWVGLGRIVYASSSEQLAARLADLGVPPPPVRTLPIQEIVPGLPVEARFPALPTRFMTCTAVTTAVHDRSTPGAPATRPRRLRLTPTPPTQRVKTRGSSPSPPRTPPRSALPAPSGPRAPSGR